MFQLGMGLRYSQDNLNTGKVRILGKVDEGIILSKRPPSAPRAA